MSSHTRRAAPSPSPTPSPSPRPTKSVPAPAPLSAQAGRFGLSTGNTLPGLSDAELATRLDDFRALGVGWVRLDFDWNDIQHSGPTNWNWGRLDAVVNAANARGLHVLPILTYTPGWARSAGCGTTRCSPADPSQYAAFAAAAAARYAPMGVHNWEIWNEPNDNGSWLPQASASAYTQLLRVTYPAIKHADATATVISGGLASTDTDEGVPQITFLQQMYAAGGKAFFDAVGYHPYSYPVPASYNVSWSAWTKMGLTSPSLRSIMVANGDTAKQIWATEFGAPTGGPGPIATTTNYNLNGSPDHVNEALQAAMATDVVSVTNATPWLATTFWYSYIDEGTSASDTENFYGLLRANGTRKPAYTALQAALTH